MGTYTAIAAADIVFLPLVYVFARFGMKRDRGIITVVAVLLAALGWFGVLYLVAFLAMILPACPNGRWAC